MASFLFPRESTSAFNGGAGAQIQVFTDPNCTSVATITNVDGSAVASALLTLDSNGYIPAFVGTVNRLYATLKGVVNPARNGAVVVLTQVGEAAAGSSEQGGILLALPSTTIASTWTSWDLATGDLAAVEIDINVSASTGTSPTVTPSFQRKAPDGNYYTVWTGTAIAGTGPSSTTIGVGGPTNSALSEHGRLVLTLGGTASPTATLTANITAVEDAR